MSDQLICRRSNKQIYVIITYLDKIDKKLRLEGDKIQTITIKPLHTEKANCMVCGADIIHETTASTAKCHYCGTEEETYIQCKNGHYVCNYCHTRDALQFIERICLETELKDTIALAERIMEHPSMHMHGPEHHSIVPAAFVATYQNFMGLKDGTQIKEAIKRGSKIPGGYCSICGTCGAGMGIGIAVSIIMGATSFTPVERSHANRATSRALEAIANAGGARCCKKATRTAIRAGVAYISEVFNIQWADMLDTDIQCQYPFLNKECDVNCEYRTGSKKKGPVPKKEIR